MVKEESQIPVRIHKIPINTPFELRVIETKDKIGLLLFHLVYQTPTKVKCVLLSRKEAKMLCDTLTRILAKEKGVGPLREVAFCEN